MKKWIIVFVSLYILFGCTPKPDQLQPLIEQTLTAIPTATMSPTNTPFPTFTLLPTYTPARTQTPNVIIQTVVVIASETPTQLYTPTITNTATSTSTLTPTLDPLKTPRGNGFYLIGVEIAPGVWDSDGTGDGCYWKVTNAEGKTLDNHYGLAGGAAYLPSTAFQVLFEDCGTWTWLQP